ncbi:MAG: transketolase family protein, partial [Sulfolobales archaeon]
MRDALGLILSELGSDVPDLVVITADVGKATRAY